MIKMLRLSMCVVTLLAVALPVSAAQGLTCTSSPLVVACFEAYKTRLRSFHGPQLEAIADKIAASRNWKQPVDYITVVGHSARFKSTDPVEENAKGRAESVARALAEKLNKRGLTGIKIVRGAFGDSEPRTTNSTRTGRALNRRAEIILGSQAEVKRRINTLNELCAGREGRSKTIVVESPDICRSLTQAHQSCWSELSPTAKQTYFGAGCHPLSLHCVLCREG